MRFTHVIAISGFLAAASTARAESLVPLNYVDDFGTRSAAFASGGNSSGTADLDGERIASVNGPGTAWIATPGVRITATSPTPSLDRELVAGVNGPNGAEIAPHAASAAQTSSELARQ